jgi:tetratricopeptide (TPR) repeat protein
MRRIALLAAALTVLAAGCGFGPRPAPLAPDTSRERAVQGSSYFDQGRFDRAEREFKNAYYQDLAADQRSALARDYGNLAALAVRQGDHASAIDYLAREADIYRGMNDSGRLARSLAARAAVEDAAGKAEEAAGHIAEALKLVPEAGEARLYALNIKGSHMIRGGDAVGAQAPLREAVGMGKSLGADPRLRAASCHYLGRSLLAKGDREGAERLLGEALELDRAGDNPAGIASDLARLAGTLAASGRPTEGLRLYEQAFNLYIYLKDVRRAGEVLAQIEGHGRQASLPHGVAKLRETLRQVKADCARDGGYSWGSTSTTQ